MHECYNCGIEGSKAQLFDAIAGEGVVKVCANCLKEHNIPLLKKPTEDQIKLAGKGGTVYERLSRMRGINSREHMMKFHPEEVKKKEKLKEETVTLRDLVEKNFEKRIGKNHQNINAIPRGSLIDNFNWAIMNSRRRQKITIPKLAESIEDSETAIKKLESGELPPDYRLISKLENFLKIKLIKDEKREEVQNMNRMLGFDSHTAKSLTLADLKEMKNKISSEEDENLEDLDEEFGEGEEDKKKEKKGFFSKLIFGE
jgi:putative transcription factor